MLTATLVTAAFAVSIVACVAPEEDCIGRTIDTAQQEILVSAYVLTGGPALIRAGQSVTFRD